LVVAKEGQHQSGLVLKEGEQGRYNPCAMRELRDGELRDGELEVERIERWRRWSDEMPKKYIETID
jgi:hypothetical protein